jgi:6-pyruvoyl-tetrahydropterin synthase
LVLGGIVKHFLTARQTFEAAHHVESHSLCGVNHGHRWTIEVSVTGQLDAKKVQLVDHGDLVAALATIVAELRDRDLNDMLPGVITTPEGLGLYIRERLTLAWPRLSYVRITMGESISIIVESELR